MTCIMAIELMGVMTLSGNMPTSWSITDIFGSLTISVVASGLIWIRGRKPFKRLGMTSPSVTAKRVVTMK